VKLQSLGRASAGITSEDFLMVRVEMPKWGQSLDDLPRLALQAPHHRTRQRFLALSMIADGTHNATTWAARYGRQDDTVLLWLHLYNQKGPDALTYRRTGGAPLLRPKTPKPSSRPSPRPSRSTTTCPATAGRRRNSASGSWTTSAAR